MPELIKNKIHVHVSLQETHFRSKDTHRLKIGRWKKVFQENGNKGGVTIRVSDKIDFKTKMVQETKKYMI